MQKQITRRDFLKMAGLLSVSAAIPKLVSSISSKQNVLVIVFDAFSASNISLHGYERETTPYLARLAERAIVYHNHYSGSNFTTPGTASLLTGTVPWTHRALQKNSAPAHRFATDNMFSAFREYYTLAYTHNLYTNVILNHMRKNIIEFMPLELLFLTTDGLIPKLFGRDHDIASVSWTRTIKKRDERFAYSLFLSHLYEKYKAFQVEGYKPQFPRGLPSVLEDNYFLLEDAIDYFGNKFTSLPQPFMGYIHLYPPHAPYNTHTELYSVFEHDGYKPVEKPIIKPAESPEKMKQQLHRRTEYDEYILYVDREFGRLMDNLEDSGVLENTWVILTSDHGELFERGIVGHISPLIYEPVIRVPLMIFEPGRTSRTDIYTRTSAIDVLPTLLHVTGQTQVNWTEGTVMPPFTEKISDFDRSLYVVAAKFNKNYDPLKEFVIAHFRDNYKLLYHFGNRQFYNFGGEGVELYNLEQDPEELNDLSLSKRETAAELLNMLKLKLEEVNEPYL